MPEFPTKEILNAKNHRNLYEILKDAPDGLAMYSRAHGQVRVYKRGIEDNLAFRLEHNPPCFHLGKTIGYLDTYGRILPGGECMLFPNVNCDWDNWQDCLMEQSPCMGKIIYCEEEDKFYQISGLNTVRTVNGHVKIATSFKGCRFATKEERVLFLEASKRSIMCRVLKKNTKPGDLVVVRKDTCAPRGNTNEWILGHFSHYDNKLGLFITTESAFAGRGYRECLPYDDATQELIGTDTEPTLAGKEI